MTYEETRATLAKFYGWTFDAIDNMSFEQIDSAIACMPEDQGDGTVRAVRRQRGIPVNSIEEAREINRRWREYVGV